jgi:hypothetical protein
MVVGCGGGGGSSIAPGAGSSNATSTPAPVTISGIATDYSSGDPLAGFTVTVGQLPTNTTCLAAQSATSMPCGAPASPLASVATASTGAFSVSVPTTGTYMLTIGKDATYATLHRAVAVTSASVSIGTAKVTALTSDEQAWLVDVNNQRVTVSSPTSFGNLVVDEYAEEQARQWAADTLSGKTVYGDAGYAPYQAAYGAAPGSLYSAAGALAANTNTVLGQYIFADDAWMGEKANCPNGNWQTCTFAANTGHYINISNTNTVWIGLGEAANPMGDTTFNSYYDLMLIENLGSSGPASKARAI